MGALPKIKLATVALSQFLAILLILSNFWATKLEILLVNVKNIHVFSLLTAAAPNFKIFSPFFNKIF
jgi:hypothetical protein